MTIRLLMLAAVVAGMGPATALADTVVPGKSEIAFTMKQMGVNFDGRFKAWKADIVFKTAALDQSKATIDIDLASLDLASADSEAEARDRYGSIRRNSQSRISRRRRSGVLAATATRSPASSR